MRKWIRQGNERVCGQIAVAVIAERELEDVLTLCGHRHGTTSRELAWLLYEYGFFAPGRARRRQAPELGIAQVRREGRSDASWHWVAYADGLVWDGTEEGPLDLYRYEHRLRWTGQRITSWLPVKAW